MEKTVSDEKKVVTSCLWTLDCDVYKPCCHRETNANGEYVEVWCVVCATLCHAHTEVRIYFSASVYVPYF